MRANAVPPAGASCAPRLGMAERRRTVAGLGRRSLCARSHSVCEQSANPPQSLRRGQPRPAHRPRRLVPRPRDRAARTCTWAPCCVFDGEAPAYDDSSRDRAPAASRPPLPPEARVPAAGPGPRPVWVDDPHFNAGYHVRHTALPEPAAEHELKRLAGRVFSQWLDRSKPLWEMWLVHRVGEDQFAFVCKTHHALVDGISGVDIMNVMFDLEPDPPEADPAGLVPAPGAERRAAVRRRRHRARGFPLRPRARAPRRCSPTRMRADQLGTRGRRSGAMPPPGCGRAPQPAQHAHRTAPALRLGVGDLDPSRRSRARSAGRSTTSCSRSWRGALRAHLGAAGDDPEGRAEGDGAGLGAGRGRARSARQQRGRDLRAAAGGDRRSARALPGRARGARRPEEVRPGDRRRDAHPARRLRRRRRCSTRPRGCSRSSGSST